MVDVLRPARDACEAHKIDRAAQAEPGSSIAVPLVRRGIDPPAGRLDPVPVVPTGRAVTRQTAGRIWIERPVLVRVVEHSATVVVDELSDSAPSAMITSWVSSSMWKYSTFRPARPARSRRRYEILGFDQHAVEIHRMMRRNPQIALRHVLIERAGLDADRQDVLRPRRSGRNSCAARST